MSMFESLRRLAMAHLHEQREFAKARHRARRAGPSLAEIEELVRRNSRKRPRGLAPALVDPPRGPLPLQGGAEAPLEFRED